MIRPLLIISDAPSGTSGLARIGADIARQTVETMSDVFRVATLGSNGIGSSRFPWLQHNMNPTSDWLITELPDVLNDFVRDGERPIIMTIWDSTRLSWLANPKLCPDPRLRQMVEKRNFDLWGYFPLDADSFGERIGFIARETISKFDRVLMYSDWAACVVHRSCSTADGLPLPVAALPHGISSTFTPRDRGEARRRFQGLPDNAILVGIVATNQRRKDWALGLQVVAALSRNHENVYVWIHTDALFRKSEWDIFGILHELGLTDQSIRTPENFSDEEMAFMYSACDVTLGIGAGEGFGYPIFESLACGTPCVHGNYAGAPEYMSPEMLVEPIAFHYDGMLANRRPVFAVEDWVKIVECNLQNRVTLNEQLRWEQLWPRFENWLREGL